MIDYGQLLPTESFEEARCVEFLQDKPEWGVTIGKLYDLKYDSIDESIGQEYYILDDHGKCNVGVILCLRNVLYK